MAKTNNETQTGDAETVSRQMMVPVEQLKNNQVGIGFAAHGNVQDVRLLTEVKYRRAVQANIKTQLEAKKAADAKVKAAAEAYVKAVDAIRPPKDFTTDLKSLYAELKRFIPGAVLPLFSIKADGSEDDQSEAKPGAGMITISDFQSKSQYETVANFIDSGNGGRSILSVRRSYPHTKEIEEAAKAHNEATVEAAAAEAKLVELRGVLAGVGAVADDAAAVMAQFNLQNSGDLGNNLLGAIGDMLQKRAKADGLDVSAEPAALSLAAPSTSRSSRS